MRRHDCARARRVSRRRSTRRRSAWRWSPSTDAGCGSIGGSAKSSASTKRVSSSDRSRSMTHPEDRTADREEVRSLARRVRTTATRQKRYLDRSGEVVWVNRTTSLVRRGDGSPDYFFAVVEDIRERRRYPAGACGERRRPARRPAPRRARQLALGPEDGRAHLVGGRSSGSTGAILRCRRRSSRSEELLHGGELGAIGGRGRDGPGVGKGVRVRSRGGATGWHAAMDRGARRKRSRSGGKRAGAARHGSGHHRSPAGRGIPASVRG